MVACCHRFRIKVIVGNPRLQPPRNRSGGRISSSAHRETRGLYHRGSGRCWWVFNRPGSSKIEQSAGEHRAKLHRKVISDGLDADRPLPIYWSGSQASSRRWLRLFRYTLQRGSTESGTGWTHAYRGGPQLDSAFNNS